VLSDSKGTLDEWMEPEWMELLKPRTEVVLTL